MEEKKINVKEWQYRFNSGEFNKNNVDTQCKAGWFDWFCKDSALLARTQKLANIVMRVKNKNLLDSYYIYFKNCAPMTGPTYDTIGFRRIDGVEGQDFCICVGDKRELFKYNLYSEWSGFTVPCFMSDNVSGLMKYLNNENGFPPKQDVLHNDAEHAYPKGGEANG
jgi:hypothetical protein